MYLHPDFAAHLSADERTFSSLFHMTGVLYREAPGRRTVRFTRNGAHYFLKAHTGAGWREIIKNLIHLRLPVLSALTEWNAIHHLRAIGLDTVTPIGYGCVGWNPARIQSFIITRDLGQTLSLEELGTRWTRQRVLNSSQVAFKRLLITRVAEITRIMHDSGLNHRDLYLCHIHIPSASLPAEAPSESPRIYVMDLHRAQLRRHPPPRRWIVKDLAGLHFSSMEYRLTRRDRLRFIAAYSRLEVRTAVREQAGLWLQVDRRACRLYAKLAHPRILTYQ